MRNVQLIHIFDPSFIAGEPGSRIEKKFVLPVVTASQLEIMAFYPGDPAQEEVLALLRRFSGSCGGFTFRRSGLA